MDGESGGGEAHAYVPVHDSGAWVRLQQPNWSGLHGDDDCSDDSDDGDYGNRPIKIPDGDDAHRGEQR